jgi:hypothetical protein
VGDRASLGPISLRRSPNAKEAAADETGLPLSLFSVDCEYTIEQILDREFLPGAIDS